MTAIIYPDRETLSPGGRFTLEARSPHNGTIAHRDGRAPSESDFAFKYRQHQREFRYRLLDRASGGAGPRVVWERWQPRGEDSPHELVVSDDGWSILRTHGFNPELIAVSPSGHDTVRVGLVGKRGEDEDEEEEGEPEPREGRRYEWQPLRLAWSTAGTYWAHHSWPYFLRRDDTRFFVWRAFWGQRLVLDLSQATLLPDDDPARAALNRWMDEEEARGASALLTELSARMDEVQGLLASRAAREEEAAFNPLREKLGRAVAAFHLVGVHRIEACVSLLQRWEALNHSGYATTSTAFGADTLWWVEAQAFRPIIHHALRLLGVQPQGHAAYRFRANGQGWLPMPEQVTGQRQRAADLEPSMSAEQVLRWMGAPAHIRRRSHPVGKFYRWTEEWEYDFQVEGRWVTLHILWEEHQREGRIVSIQERPADWLQSDERVLEILDHH